MSNIYLVRHGQAGTRDAYDSLSDLGHRQARLLGEYFVSQDTRFAAAYVGGMLRQQQTAAEVSGAYLLAGVPFPRLIIDNNWNEFDLARVYREIGFQLGAEDPEFQREYDEMRRQINESAGAHDADVQRRWRPCDSKVVATWIAGRFPYGGETWDQFCARVAAGLSRMSESASAENILVLTSATPTGVIAGLALDIGGSRVRQLAGVLRNTSYTVVHRRAEQLQLFQFNAAPHLTTPEVRTSR